MPSEPTPQKISDVPMNPHPPGPSKPCPKNPMNSQWQYNPQRDQWDIFQFDIPKKLPNYNDFPHASEPLLLDANQPSSFDEFSFDMFKNSPHANFGLESIDTYDEIELETTDNHIVQSSSNIYTDDPLPTSSVSQPPAPEWTKS